MSIQPPPLPALNPYAAPESRVDDLPTGELQLAGRGTRLLAAIVDALIFSIPYYLALMFLLPGMMGVQEAITDVPYGPLLGFVGAAGLLALIVANGVLLHRHGQTIAKRLFKIRVVRSDGDRCSLPRIIFARWLPVTLLSMIPLIGLVVALVDSLLIFRADHRCMHDHIADTIVVNA
ncbi:MAG TPA: RDD family protein [Candidatus Saccharimonadia bacterium]|nr:RDD family protein [Candidatus Saccharimonadia bacterium]